MTVIQRECKIMSVLCWLVIVNAIFHFAAPVCLHYFNICKKIMKPILDYGAQGSGADPGSWQSACR